VTLSAEQRQDRLSRPCKRCGKPLNSLRTGRKVAVFCSTECRVGSKKAELREVQCCVCEKHIVRRVEKSASDGAKFCCSRECQRVWAGHCGIKWIGRSAKARIRFRFQRSRSRKRNSDSYRFWVLCKNGLKQQNQDVWIRRCESASGLLRERFIGESRNCKPVKSWKCCIRREATRVKSQWNNQILKGEWEWKAISVASGLRRRKRKKLLQKGNRSISEHIEKLGRQPKQLGFWA